MQPCVDPDVRGGGDQAQGRRGAGSVDVIGNDPDNPTPTQQAARTLKGGTTLNIAVVGAGYVGLVTSAGLAQLGHRVTGIEIEPGRLASLMRGQLPIFEPGLDELVA